MKQLLIILMFLPLASMAQSRRYATWKSDSTRRHDSTFRHYDTAFKRLRYGFRMANENYHAARTHVDSVYWGNLLNKYLQELQPLEKKHDDENYRFGQKNVFKQ